MKAGSPGAHILFFVIFLVCSWGLFAQQEPPGMARLVAHLRGGSEAERSEAIQEVLRIRPDERTPEIRSALIDELARILRDTAKRSERLKAGDTLAPVEDHGLYMQRVIEALSQDSNPAVIDPLCEVIDTGGLAMNALARFGGVAVDRVKSIAATSPDTGKTSGALRVLKLMVVAQKPSVSTQRDLAMLAIARLKGKQDPIVVGAAAELGLTLGDVTAVNRVRALHDDVALIQEMGITETDMIAWLRERLSRLLAAHQRGGPPSPKPLTPGTVIASVPQ